MRSESLRLSPGARAALAGRCGGACEACGLEWPWLLYVFRIDAAGSDAAANLLVLCSRCSEGRPGPFRPLLGTPSVREKLRAANNRRSGAAKLTAARRRRLIAARGGRCQICGVPGSERQLDVHHRRGIFLGGDDAEENLLVLCFACHHHLRPCAAGCGRWAKVPARLCRRCQTERLVSSWVPGYGQPSPGTGATVTST